MDKPAASHYVWYVRKYYAHGEEAFQEELNCLSAANWDIYQIGEDRTVIARRLVTNDEIKKEREVL